MIKKVDKEVAKYNSNNNLVKSRVEKKKENLKEEAVEEFVFPTFYFDGS